MADGPFQTALRKIYNEVYKKGQTVECKLDPEWVEREGIRPYKYVIIGNDGHVWPTRYRLRNTVGKIESIDGNKVMVILYEQRA